MSEQDIENGNSQNTEESLESIIASQDTTGDENAKLVEANKKLFARAKAAEEKLKANKDVTVNTPHLETNSPVTPLSREEAILIAKGVDEKSLQLLQKISKLNGVSLLEAQKDEIYLAMLAKNEQEEKKQNSRLGASHGSGRIEPKKTQGLTAEEHKALFNEMMG